MKSRLRNRAISASINKKILAEWQELDLYDPDLMNILNDAMIDQTPIELNYEGSGTRDVVPYAFTQTKDGNVLLNVYKDTGEIRRYRFDRINNIWIDSNDLQEEENYDEMNNMEQQYEQPQEVQEEVPQYDDPDLNGETNEVKPEEEVYDTDIFDENQVENFEEVNENFENNESEETNNEI